MIKQFGKAFLVKRLSAQVTKLRSKNNITVIAVCGSVGKTTTKLAIAKMLEPDARIQYQTGNYNDPVTVPLVFFGHKEPAIFNVPAWLKILAANKRALRKAYPYDVVVVELGSDGPGQIAQFAYIKPDITVVTALTDEHMEYFKTIEAVAEEELTAVGFSKLTLINTDDSPAKYLEGLNFKSYGSSKSDYQMTNRQPQANGEQVLKLSMNNTPLTLNTSLQGKHGAKSVLAAAAVAYEYGLKPEVIAKNASNITAVPGRMQQLKGEKDSTIIDDSYNASPVAVKAALDTLYAMPTTQRIALLGNMNEMGELSPRMHKDVGNYCDPTKLDLVLTLGPDANKHLAPAAKSQGCKVQTCESPYQAGEIIKQQLQNGAVVLIKGSQNRVFAEEAIKSILADPADASKLVRQSDYWLKIKHAQFNV